MPNILYLQSLYFIFDLWFFHMEILLCQMAENYISSREVSEWIYIVKTLGELSLLILITFTNETIEYIFNQINSGMVPNLFLFPLPLLLSFSSSLSYIF